MPADAPRLMAKPIHGGVFGSGRFALASVPAITRGLHGARYLVLDPQGGAVLGVGEDRAEALASARRLIAASNDLSATAAQAIPEQGQLWSDEELAPVAVTVRANTTPVPRRRREIHEKCAGRCHYCSTSLVLDGDWHIEHMLPRALGGGDDVLNLVAACTSCNLRKGDRTALEFIAAGGARR